ncbi:MAG: hypothetical protein JWO85_75 [Candidatus Eremiobacteraeota bacterium]|nr:hypothetical protein [Candidatus Eremiobacteraeota bacterium]
MIVAVAVESERIAAWQRSCIDALRDAPGVDVRIVRTQAPPRRPLHRFARLLGGAALAPSRVVADAAATLDDVAIVLDLTSTGAVDANARHGIWSFRLDRSDDAALPFAREIAQGAEWVEISLVSCRNGSRETLRSGRFGVGGSYGATLRLALLEAARWPSTMLRALANGVESPPALDAPRSPPTPSLPPLEALRFAGALGARAASLLRERFLEVVEWNVGFVEGGPKTLLNGAPLQIRWLPPPAATTFIADPFFVERDGLRVLFVEEFDYRRDRGVVDALVLDANGRIARRVRALDIPTHVSYPYPLEIDGELYLVPENRAGNEVALYRCVRFPDRWERARAIMPASDAIDTTLFRHDGRWWALCTRVARGENQALFAYHAASIDGPWTPHAMNPVVVDVTSARPAGRPFTVDGVLYRPGQDCSTSYGCGLTIARVDVLTPSEYRETLVRRIEPSASSRYPDGIHTVNFSGALGVVDGKVVRYDWRKLAWIARKALARRR